MIKTIAKENAIVAYKAVAIDSYRSNFPYSVGESYHIDGEVKLYENGFHACKCLIDAFNYYPIEWSRFAVVKLWGDVLFGIEQICASDIEIVDELSLTDVVKYYVSSKVDSLSKTFDKRIVLNEDENDLYINGEWATIISIYDKKKIVINGNNNDIMEKGEGNTILSLGDYCKISALRHVTSVLCGDFNTINLLDGGYVVSNGNNCTTNITHGFTHFVTNGNGNRIIATGKNIIDSKGIDNEIVMLGDHIFFRGTDGSTVICAGKEKMVVGNGELMADTWYTYDDGVFKYNEIKNDIYNTVKKIQRHLN